MKSDGRLAHCLLKGTIGDALFAVLCGCGHNIRKIRAHPGSGFIDHIQKMTIAAIAMADMKVWAHRW